MNVYSDKRDKAVSFSINTTMIIVTLTSISDALLIKIYIALGEKESANSSTYDIFSILPFRVYIQGVIRASCGMQNHGGCRRTLFPRAGSRGLKKETFVDNSRQRHVSRAN